VTTLSLSGDGHLVVAGDVAGAVRVWNVESGTLKATLPGQTAPSFPRLAPDGNHVVSASYDGTVRIWAAPHWRQVAVFRDHGDQVYAAALDGRARRLVSGGSNGHVVVRRLTARATTPPVVLTGHKGAVNDVAFSPADRHVISAGVDGTVRIWDASRASAPPTVLRGHDGPVDTVAFSRDGRHVVSAGADGTVRVWNLTTHRSIVLRGHDGAVASAAFNVTGDRVVSAGLDGTVRIWDPATGALLVTLRRHPGLAGNAVFDPAGGHVISGGRDGIWVDPCEVCGSLADVRRLARARVERRLSATERQRFGQAP
jgi:WD40 repeat protein